MDFSDIVQPPADQQQPEQPQPPAVQKKPYWQVLDEYQRAGEQSPDLAGLSLPQFSQKMNEVTGTNNYDEGLNDSWVRRAGANIERGLRHFGGTFTPQEPVIPGIPSSAKWPSLSELLGGPRTGVDVPAMAHEAGKSVATQLGAGPELAEKIGGATESLPKTGVIVGAGAALGGIPTIAGLSALESYGETGSIPRALISGGTAAAIPAAAEFGGQAALRALGAKTIGELSPATAAVMDRALPSVQKYLSRYEAEAGWSPTSLVQRGAKFGGAQVGMMGAGMVGQAGETIADPNLSLEQKLQEVGGEFSPSNLVATAVGQLPFTFFDLTRERTNPLAKIESAANADFARRYANVAMTKGDPATGSPPFVPTMDEINKSIQALTTGKIEPDSKEAGILRSMGQIPLGEDMAQPVITSEKAVPVPEARESTRQIANQMVRAQGGPENALSDTHNQILYHSLRATELATGGKATMEDTYYQAAAIAADEYWKSAGELAYQGEPLTPLSRFDRPEMGEHLNTMKEIVSAITPPTPDSPNPKYNKEAHQRVALVSGDPGIWREAGIEGPVRYDARGVSQPLSRSVIDLLTGMGPIPSMDPYLTSRQTEWWNLNREKTQLEGQPTTPESDLRKNQIATRQAQLENEIGTRETQLQAEGRAQRTAPAAKGGKGYSPLYGSTVQKMIERAYNYGSLPGDRGRTLDLSDPKSVKRFIDEISHVMKQEQVGVDRIRAGETLLKPVYASETDAGNAAKSLDIQFAEDPGPWSYQHYAKQDDNGNWRVNRTRTQKVQGITDYDRSEKMSDEDYFKQQVSDEVMGQANEPATLQQVSEMVPDNFIEKYRDELQKKVTDPAEYMARMNALARNAIYYIQHLPEERFKDLVLGEAIQRFGIRKDNERGIRNVEKIKDRMIKYLQYIRIGGRVNTEVQYRAPAYEEGMEPQPQEIRTGTGYRRVVDLPERPEEVKPEPMGYRRLRATDKDELARLNEYMGDLGWGTYTSGAAAGQQRGDDWNRSKSGGLNFFEQFNALMKDFEKQLPSAKVLQWQEMMPKGDLSYMPPDFRDDILKRLVVKWAPELTAQPFGVAAGTFEKPTGEPVTYYVQDSSGKRILVEASRPPTEGAESVPINPLQHFFVEGAKNEWTMKLGELLDLFDKYGVLDDESKGMLQIARRLSDPRVGESAFVRDMPVGVAPAIRANDKAYFHTDTVASSAGMLISPYRLFVDEKLGLTPEQEMALNARAYGGKWIRQLMAPNEIFPHLMNEVGHSAGDFAYNSDKPFKAEIDQIFDYVKNHIKGLQGSTGAGSDWSRVPLHSLSNAREFLAGIYNDKRLHQLLSTIDDPFGPLEGAPVTTARQSLFERIRQVIGDMLRRLFNIAPTDGNKLLDRMTQLASRGFDIQQGMNLTHRGDIYGAVVEKQLIPGTSILETPQVRARQVTREGVMRVQPQTPEGIKVGEPYAVRVGATEAAPEQVPKERPPWWQVGGVGGAPFTPWEPTPIEHTQIAQGLPPSFPTVVIKNHESRLLDAQTRLRNLQESRVEPGFEESAQAAIAREQANVANEERILNELRSRKARGEILPSRTVPDDGETEIPKPVFNIQGRKGTLLRDPVVNNIVSTFSAGQNVFDAFSGSGQLSTFAKAAGANNVTTNVYRPEMHAIFDEIKNNPVGFGRRVANAASRIDSPRKGGPKMRDGSDLRAYLDQVQAQDPNVGLFLKQNLSYLGREVGPETFTPGLAITNQGLSELPDRINRFSTLVDNVTRGNGWDMVANARAGDRVMVDPPYVSERARYGVGAITPDQRIADYEKYMYPATRNGANFLVFDVANPQLMQSLSDNGFTVQPVQRTGRVGREAKAEFVAYNHSGEILPSRVSPQAVLDSLQSATLYLHENTDDIWFRPYDSNYFRSTYGPMFGSQLRLDNRGGEIGYSLNKRALDTVTNQDIARMPPPDIKPWTPTLFETLSSMYRQDGSNQQTADAIAAQMLGFGALLRDTDASYWGQIPSTETKTGIVLGRAWGWNRVGGLTQEALGGAKPLDYTIRHESAHLAGFHADVGAESPDIQAAYKQVTDVFNSLDEAGRRTFLDSLALTTQYDGRFPGRYEAAVQSPSEFAAEFMGHVGDIITNMPKPSAYLKDEMRFVPDELSRLLILNTLRRQQGLERFRQLVETESNRRGIKDVPWQNMVTDVTDAFKSLARSALDIMYDQAEFYRSRFLYSDSYQGLLNQAAQNLLEFGKGRDIDMASPTLPSEFLASKSVEDLPPGGIEGGIREYFTLPDTSGKVPAKLTVWDRFFTQFSQLANKYPVLRPAWDMFFNGRSLYNNFRIKMATALAGSFEGGKLLDDVRTKAISDFQSRDDLRKAYSGVVLEMQKLGDYKFNKELSDSGNVMNMNPQEVTGWVTPGWIQGALRKYGVQDKDMQTMLTVLDGTRNQITVAQQTILGSWVHRLDAAIATRVSRVTGLSPEESRKAAQVLTDAVKTQNTDPTSVDKLNQFMGIVKNQDAYYKMYDMANTMWGGIQRLQRFMELRQPYFMSERRPGQFGVFFEDDKGKMTSRYFRSDADRRRYMEANRIDPESRQVNPTDKNWGVSPDMFRQLDDIQNRMTDKLKNLFGESDGAKLAVALDFASDLRDSLNSRDVLKMTTGRDLAPGREELDMFSAHQQYINAVGRAAYNTFVRLEAELVNTDASLDNQPALKDYINAQVKQVLQPDSPLGSQAQKLSFFYYLFANPSSMIMQMSHQIMGLAPMLTARGTSIAGSFATIGRANRMVIESRFGGKYKDPEIQNIVDRAREDGSLRSWFAQEMDMGQDLSIVNRLRATTGKGLWAPFDMLKNRLYQGYNLLKQMYDWVPSYNAEIALVASALHLRSAEGGSLTGDQLYNEAQFLRANTMLTGGKENRPGMFQYMPRSASQALYSLQTYANGLTTMMGELFRRSVNPRGAGLTPPQAKQVRYAAAQMLFTQTAVAGVLGLPFAQAALYGLQKLFPDHNIELDIHNALASLFGDDEQMGHSVSTILTEGIPSSLPYAPDLGSRFALAGVFHVSPYSGVGWQQLMGPTGGVFDKGFQSLQAGLHGDPYTAVQELMPNGFQRIWKTLEQGQNYQTQSGKTLATDLGPGEIVARAIGFRPARVVRLEDFQRLTKASEDAEKAQQTSWTKKQVDLLRQNRDVEVQQNLLQRNAETGGRYTSPELANAIARAYEAETMPVNYRAFGNRATVLAQKSLRGVLGTQDEGPSNVERLQLQQSIANRLGLGGPRRGSLLHAANVDQLLSMYPHLTNAQANLLLTHAAASQPTPELRQALTTGY